nr:RecName: Full=Alkaline protease Cc3 [Coprinus comatus]
GLTDQKSAPPGL